MFVLDLHELVYIKFILYELATIIIIPTCP